MNGNVMLMPPPPPLFVLYGESRMKHIGADEHDLTAHDPCLKVLSLGDANSYFLTTAAGNELGVLSATCVTSGKKMAPTRAANSGGQWCRVPPLAGRSLPTFHETA
jgi:hypothetical protein